MTATRDWVPGLAGVVAARTRLSLVDGEAGRLIVAGYPIEELAAHASFEEAVLTLWRGARPAADEVARFRGALAEARRVPTEIVDVVGAMAARGADPMEALRAGVGLMTVPAGSDDEAAATRILGALPTLLAAFAGGGGGATGGRRAEARAAESQKEAGLTPQGVGLESGPKRSSRVRTGPLGDDGAAGLGHAAALLTMLGTEATPARVRALETYLVTVMDHGLNASTFAARVVVSTGSDLVSAVVAAIGALKGPLHGGAPGPALATVFEVGSAERADRVLREKLRRGERLMGFGHRVYRVRDPRAEVLALAAERLFDNGEDRRLYELFRTVESTATRLLDEHKPGRRLRANVELYTALLLHTLGIETALFSAVFALGRCAGWLAHCFEQRAEGRLIRPSSTYIGDVRHWEAQRP